MALEKNREQKVIALEGLRGLAVLLVVLSHLGNAGIDPVPFLSFSGIGKAGVYLFFVLSAYLLTQQSLEYSTKHGIQDWRYWLGYFIRRVFRIYPLYFIILCLAVMAGYFSWPFINILSSSQLLNHLLLQEGIGVYWTIPVEFSYYLLIPLVTVVCIKAKQYSAWLSPCLVLVAIIFSMTYWPAAQSPINGITLGFYLPIFLLGSLVAIVRPCLKESVKYLVSPWSKFFQFTFLLGILFTVPSVWNTVFNANIPNDYFHRSYVLYGLLWAIIMALLIHAEAGKLFFSSHIMCFFGRISFSVYLTHFPIVGWASGLEGSDASRSLIALLCITSLGFIMYELIEKPSMKLGKKLSMKLVK